MTKQNIPATPVPYAFRIVLEVEEACDALLNHFWSAFPH